MNRLRLVVRRLKADRTLKALGLPHELVRRALAGYGLRAGSVMLVLRAVEDAERARPLS